MKYNALRHYNFTADLWKFTTQTDAAGGQTYTYTYDRAVEVFLTTSQLGKLTVYFKPEDDDIVVKQQLLNVKDAVGNELISNGVFQVGDVQAQLNIWGVRSGVKCRVDYIGQDA